MDATCTELRYLASWELWYAAADSPPAPVDFVTSGVMINSLFTLIRTAMADLKSDFTKLPLPGYKFCKDCECYYKGPYFSVVILVVLVIEVGGITPLEGLTPTFWAAKFFSYSVSVGGGIVDATCCFYN